MTDPGPIVALALITFALGVVLGFVGAGGAGLAVGLLTGVFHLPIHQAIGTALASMCVVTVAGAASHYREGNVAARIGLVVGLAGMVGAVAGANTSQFIPAATLKPASGIALWLLAGLVWFRTRWSDRIPPAPLVPTVGPPPARPGRDWAASIGLGLSGGVAAAVLGVGMAPYLQLGFITVLKLPLRQTVGTTMLTLVFISAAGSLALASHGDVSVPHLLGTTAGLASGSFVGARYTRRVRREVVRFALVAVPFVAGAMLLFL